MIALRTLLSIGALCSLLATATGCGERAPVRGPSSEPVGTLPFGLLQLTAGSAAPKAQSAAARLPTPAQLLAAFAPLSGDDIEFVLVPTVPSGSPAAPPPTPEESAPIALVALLDLSRLEPLLIGDGATLNTLEAASHPGVRLLLGSPFVAEFSPLKPLGLLQIDGDVRSELQPHGYTRVLGFGDDGIGVVSRSAFHRGLFEGALQVGPGVIEAGQLDISEREFKLPAYFRVIIASCGPIGMAAVSTRPVLLYRLGESLLAFFKSRGLSCDEAVNLSGDRQVVFAAQLDGELAHIGNVRDPKTALVGFVGR